MIRFVLFKAYLVIDWKWKYWCFVYQKKESGSQQLSVLYSMEYLLKLTLILLQRHLHDTLPLWLWAGNGEFKFKLK